MQTIAAPNLRYATVDLYQPRCRDWYASMIRQNVLLLPRNRTEGGSTALDVTLGRRSSHRGGSTRRLPGAIGWMADFGEGVPFSDAATAAAHNEFPQLWAETSRLALRGATAEEAEAGGGAAAAGADLDQEAFYEKEGLFFTRSGSTLTPRHSTLQLLGDQLVTCDRFDGLASTLGAIMASGLSGYAFSH